MSKKYVYLLDELEEAEAHAGSGREGTRGLLGGKGANLAEMKRIGIPVPQGFIITTEACNAYLASNGMLPEEMWKQVQKALKAIEITTGKQFDDAKNPLLVSCRSGAKFSMPGMMDTILNIGLNDRTAKGLIKQTKDTRFVYDAYRRLIQMFGSVVMEVDGAIFEAVIFNNCRKAGVEKDTDLTADAWEAITEEFKKYSGDMQIRISLLIRICN